MQSRISDTHLTNFLSPILSSSRANFSLKTLQHFEIYTSLKRPLRCPCYSVPDSHQDDARRKSSTEATTSCRTIRDVAWPNKSSLYILRTDGKSCTRELVTGKGKLAFAYPSTQQHLLVWRNQPKSVMVIKKLGDELLEEFVKVVEFLAVERGMKVIVEPVTYDHCLNAHAWLRDHVYTWDAEDDGRLAEHVDFVICLGGDGVILHANYLFQSSIPPVIAFNLGSLGFMTNHDYQSFREDLDSVIFGSQELESCSFMEDFGLVAPDRTGDRDSDNLGVMVTLRMRLKCEVYRNGCDIPHLTYDVLNELVIDRGPNAFLTKIECYERGRFITRVQADGIMLSTPTGSTAYSVSAGGSMVHPNVPAILLTPICAHSLSFRPILLPDYAELELRIPEDARCPAWVCFDGRSRQELGLGDSVRIKMSDTPMPTINKADLTGDWFESLDRCFRWSDRAEQRPLTLSQKEGHQQDSAAVQTASAARRDQNGAVGNENASQRDVALKSSHDFPAPSKGFAHNVV
ncbi:hypothetical protein CEUSTIGMA_g10468.t1 [Chlamydomonas eustigma]|uniref:NAD(+) kinase n=1 Tax=Chlamydomonas eustigma TaxID=1157962 RepID=A0A250XJE8_9CHLO|nr:hypothetical protein CEUSTIGMA_g10468.t1 [Chlamydomonas eustigma]|eukprot:GAX83042.1 hypothetical protein CEUSTIGMA_g10468.t1 [Chlamydomonas eustigma]